MEPFLIEEGQQEINTITGCGFYQNQNTILSTQANDQIVKVWDLRRIRGGIKDKMFKQRIEKPLVKSRKKVKKRNPLLLFSFDEQYAYKNELLSIQNQLELCKKSPFTVNENHV